MVADTGINVGTTSLGSLLEDLTLRQSLLVAVGDLLSRHPNVVEPWTDRLYAALSTVEDAENPSSKELQLTALLVLTHLVLNDLVKPRAVFLARALWLTFGSNESTGRVARILFQELSKRTNNIIYNLVPEIVARLPEYEGVKSRGSDDSESRVHYLMQFVVKEKQIEGLIEKLSIRLQQSANVAGGAALDTVPASVSTASAVPPEGIGNTNSEGPCSEVTAQHAQRMVSCLAHALGAMVYADRAIMRLHEFVVVRKMLHTAIAYHPVVRDNLLKIVERGRRPGFGRANKEASGSIIDDVGAETSASRGVSAATLPMLDAIEKLVSHLAHGRVDEEVPVPIADVESLEVSEAGVGKDETMQPVQPDNSRGQGRAGGRGRGRPAKVCSTTKRAQQAPVKAKARPVKRRRKCHEDDDEDYEEDA